ncbi:MAG: EAL domain-containing protein, partial [Methyloprofundus sp.]|nr:EAL domain-containing protein [Methyloprofundus sp.]
MKKKQIKSPLATQLTRMSITIAFIVGLVLSAFQVYLDYREEGASIDSIVTKILKVAERPAMTAVHILNEELAREVVAGLLEYEFIIHAKLSDDLNLTLADSKKKSTRASSTGWITRQLVAQYKLYSIELRPPSVRKETPGILQVTIDKDIAFQSFYHRAFTILIGGIARNMILALLLLLVFYYLITKPLISISASFSKVIPGRENTKIAVPENHLEDEIGLLCHTANRFISNNKKYSDQLVYQAHFDNLTNLPNRFLSLDRLSSLLKDAQRNNTVAAIIFLDLDDFKKINDSLGHEVGDKLLTETSARLNEIVRDSDTVGRLGGDEFIILIGGLEESINVIPVVENLLNRFRSPFKIEGRELIITISVGISVYPNDGTAPSELLRNADSAMYHSKEQGRNTYSFFTDDMNYNVSLRLTMEEQLHNALDKGELTVVYQPKIDLLSNKIMGAEALLRWNNPVLGQVSPEKFIPIAEQTGLIITIGEYVLTEALNKLKRLQQNATPSFHMAVNLSPRQFRDSKLIPFIKTAMKQTGISSKSLEMEITEGVLMSGYSNVEEIMHNLSKLGVKIAMDDFGTGYSSLSYLRSYPFDVLKIDRSFINDITISQADRELVNASIAMAHALKLKVVAEGIETEEQLALLKEMQCDYGQGYLFSKPVSWQELEAL